MARTLLEWLGFCSHRWKVIGQRSIEFHGEFRQFNNRQLVKEAIDAELKERLVGYDIVVETISITDFNFSDSFNKAIEAKVTAEQSSLEQKNLLEKVTYESQQKVIQAEAEKKVKIAVAQGEAEAIRIQIEALKGNSDILQLRWIEKWNGIMPITYVSGETTTPLLNINSAVGGTQ